MKILSRKAAANELHDALAELEVNLSLTYNDIYRVISLHGDIWHLVTSPKSNDYTASRKPITFD